MGSATEQKFIAFILLHRNFIVAKKHHTSPAS